jgi:hypothetical protein
MGIYNIGHPNDALRVIDDLQAEVGDLRARENLDEFDFIMVEDALDALKDAIERGILS